MHELTTTSDLYVAQTMRLTLTNSAAATAGYTMSQEATQAEARRSGPPWSDWQWNRERHEAWRVASPSSHY